MKNNSKRFLISILLSLLLVLESGLAVGVFALEEAPAAEVVSEETQPVEEIANEETPGLTEQAEAIVETENAEAAEQTLEEPVSDGEEVAKDDNLAALEDLVIAHDENGNVVGLDELDEDAYDGFIYCMSEDVSKRELRQMEKEIEKLPEGEDAEVVIEKELYAADSIETISEVVDAEQVQYIEPDYIVTLENTDVEAELTAEEYADLFKDMDADSYTGNAHTNPYNNQKKALDLMKIPAVWGKGVFGDKAEGNVVVAVVDSLYSTEHEDLEGAVLDGIEMNGETSGDSVGHGTFVAGIIAAQHNSIGIAGDMPGVKILPVRVFASKSASISDIAKGVDKAVENNADVINMSLGTLSYSAALETSCKNATDKGIIVVAAAGNNTGSTKEYPAAYDCVISVAATDADGSRADFSNYNESVFITAVGKSVASTTSDGGYGLNSGTSFSCPQVAALAGMAKSIDPGINTAEFETLLEDTCFETKADTSYGRDRYYGYGMIDFNRAYGYLTGTDVSDAVIDIAGKTDGSYSVEYNGIAQTPMVTVTIGGRELELVEDYSLTYSNNTNAGTASIKIIGRGDYGGRVTANFNITPVHMNDNEAEYEAKTTVAGCAFNGYYQYPAVRVGSLVSGRDYTVSYGNNFYAGTGTATVIGKGNYADSFTVTFPISGSNIASFGRGSYDVTYTGGYLYPGVYVGGLANGRDYTVAYGNNLYIGTAYASVTGIGSCYGGTTVYFNILPKGASIKSPGKAKGALTVKWKKQSSKMAVAGGKKTTVAGYQVQVARDAGFTWGVKTSSIKGYKKTSKKIKGLARKTTYYTRVRTYIKSGGETYYSDWSGATSGKTK